MDVGGSSSLLLRLFQSDYFDCHLAVAYLKTYPNSIGITHYLIGRLRAFEAAEVEFYWPQLCYLLITRPTASVALENFILERCEEDSHVAVITLWYLQASLADLSATPTSPQFGICHRLFNKVQALIFTDPPIPSSSASVAGPLSALSLRRKTKVNAPMASLVGIGIMGASVFGMPSLAATSGPMAVEQGRRMGDMEHLRIGSDGSGSGSESEEDDEQAPPAPNGLAKKLPPPPAKDRGKPSPRGSSKRRGSTLSYAPGARIEATPPSPLPPSPLPAQVLTHHQSQSQPHLSSNQSSPLGSPLRSGNFSPVVPKRSFTNPPLAVAKPFSSALVVGHRSTSTLVSTGEAQMPGAGLPKAFLSQVLRLQACRSQLDLLRSLQDISTRLVVVPKPARLSSLRAELTVLNHGLPRGCSLGMACQGSAFASSKTGEPHAHDRIVRISPSESVVLNSADRAPFVIHVEVLEGDLDFDPDRVQNAEDLRRALKERESGVGGGFSERSMVDDRKAGRDSLEHAVDEGAVKVRGLGIERSASPLAGASSSAPRADLKAPIAEMPAEMDLVEQLYGDISIRSPSPVIVVQEDINMQNRTVDEQAWSSDLPSRVNSPHRAPTVSPPETRRESLAVPGTSPPPTVRSGASPRSSRSVFSLDDYAERMRMAAIMLAQLDASEAASVSVVATGSAAAGQLVLLPVTVAAGLGCVVGGVVGAGLGAVVSIGRFPFSRRNAPAGQSESGIATALDTTSAASGTSSVSGAPPLPPKATSTTTTSALPPLANERQRVLKTIEATAIRNRIMGEMMALEEERMERMREDGRARSGWSALGAGVEDDAVVMRAVNKDDPSGAVFRESFADKVSRIRVASPYGHLPNWNVISVIVKTGADLRQEQLAIQLVKEFGRIWSEESNPCWVRYFRILVTSEGSGLIETITDAVSVHSIKKDAYARTATDGTAFTSFSLYDHYVETFGPPSSSAFRKAQDCFIKSLASYSVICYLLQLKDRHNGNILVDRVGHLIHIDFGFLLSNSPGSLGFEMAPFKLPQDYIEILGGFNSEKFVEFKDLFKRGFKDVRKHAERIITLVELMQKDSNLPCFDNGDLTSQQLRERFQLSLTQVQLEDFVDKLVMNAAMSTFTRLYDLFQYHSNGIL